MKKVLGGMGIGAIAIAIAVLALTAFHRSSGPKALTTRQAGNAIVQWADGRLAGKAAVSAARCAASTQFQGATSCILRISDGECVGITAIVADNAGPVVKDARALPARYCK